MNVVVLGNVAMTLGQIIKKYLYTQGVTKKRVIPLTAYFWR